MRNVECVIYHPQTPGMNRAAAITAARAGAEKLWAGTVVIHPKAKTGLRSGMVASPASVSGYRAPGQKRLCLCTGIAADRAA